MNEKRPYKSRLEMLGLTAEPRPRPVNRQNGTPDMRDAPAWANWLAQNADGHWHWYEQQPIQEDVDPGDWGGQWEYLHEADYLSDETPRAAGAGWSEPPDELDGWERTLTPVTR